MKRLWIVTLGILLAFAVLAPKQNGTNDQVASIEEPSS